jgi:hypothetical protein
MEPTFQTTSFIPKKPLTNIKPQVSRSVSIFTAIAIVILLGTIIFSVLTYVWEKQLIAQVSKLQKTLNTAQEKFDPYTIQTLQQLDKRINTADKVLSNHMTLSPILVNVLNANTLKKVQYTQFTHTVSGTGSSAKIQVKLVGKAKSLPYVALQSKKLASNPYVQNPIFSDIVTAKDKTVTFNLIFDVSPTLILYSNLIQALSQKTQSVSDSTITNNAPPATN